jgi:uncharacterized membrane protein YesL
MRARSASLDVLLQSFRDWWDEWVFLTFLNLVWLLCWLTIILGPPATFGLYHFGNRLAYGENLGFKGFYEGGRRYFLLSWLWMLINLVVAFIIIANIWFYTALEPFWADFLQTFFIILGILWLIVQFYALPYIMEQEIKHLGIAFRNSLFTAFAAPGYTILIASVASLIAALCVVLVFPLFVGAPCLIVILGNRAVKERLTTFQVREVESLNHISEHDENKN